MGSPISVTTIGDASDYDVREYEITLKIKGSFYHGESVPKNLGLMVNNFLRAWREGRRLLEVEMLHDSFSRILKAAAVECIAEELREKYGDEMVVSEDGKNKTAKWYVELCELCKMEKEAAKLLPYLHDDWKCSIERQLTEAEHNAWRDAITKSNEELAS